MGLNTAPSACLAHRGSTVRGRLLSCRYYMVGRLPGDCDEGRRTGWGPGRERTDPKVLPGSQPLGASVWVYTAGVGLRVSRDSQCDWESGWALGTRCPHLYNSQKVTRAATDPPTTELLTVQLFPSPGAECPGQGTLSTLCPATELCLGPGCSSERIGLCPSWCYFGVPSEARGQAERTQPLKAGVSGKGWSQARASQAACVL